jgi:hypothetical protein
MKLNVRAQIHDRRESRWLDPCHQSEQQGGVMRGVGGLVFFLGVIAVACTAPSGVEGGPCYGNGTCNDELKCTEGICKEPVITTYEGSDEGCHYLPDPWEEYEPGYDGGGGGLLPTGDGGGWPYGGRDQICHLGGCDQPELVCIDDGQAPICRQKCQVEDGGVPCLSGETCTESPADPSQSVCLPTSSLGSDAGG